MKKNLKVLVSVVCLLLAMVTSVIYVGAAQIGGGETVAPMWENTSIIQSNMGIVNGVGYAEAVCIGDFDATCVKIDAYVYRQLGYRWVYLTEGHITQYDMMGVISVPFDAAVGATFRADYIFTVTKNGIDEVISHSDYKTF